MGNSVEGGKFAAHDTPRDPVDYAKNSKQTICYGYGYGYSTGQVVLAHSARDADQPDAVPYKSSPQVLTDRIGGQINFCLAT